METTDVAVSARLPGEPRSVRCSTSRSPSPTAAAASRSAGTTPADAADRPAVDGGELVLLRALVDRLRIGRTESGAPCVTVEKRLRLLSPA